MKRKIFFFLIPLILLSGDLSADEQLARVIAQKSWTELAALCGDESHRAVEKYFAGSSSTKFVTYNINKLTYKAKFKNHAEIGAITYAKSEGRYRDLQIKNQIRPLYFIENFRKYPVKGRSIKVGRRRFTSGRVICTVRNPLAR